MMSWGEKENSAFKKRRGQKRKGTSPKGEKVFRHLTVKKFRPMIFGIKAGGGGTKKDQRVKQEEGVFLETFNVVHA